MLVKLLLLAAAGGAGTVCRFALHAATHRWLDPAPGAGGDAPAGAGPGFPWGTLAVNALGCLLFGVVFGVTESRLHLQPTTRLIVLTGFMGAFTTFSTFAHDTAHLFRSDAPALALVNLGVQNAAGLALAAGGFVVGTRL